MATQDRSGSKYELLLASSLNVLQYHHDSDTGENYLHPSPRQDLVIDDTFIQPDFVIRSGIAITAVLYSTHWSNTRSSKYKFWRTWEEQAQQKVAVGQSLISVNCIFEALPEGGTPLLVTQADQLPNDEARDGLRPLQLKGWDPGIGWALIESFDVTLLFPSGYRPVFEAQRYGLGEHDEQTTSLLRSALAHERKRYLDSQWKTLQQTRKVALENLPLLTDTRSRYRIGLLHLYLLFRIVERSAGAGQVSLADLVRDAVSVSGTQTRLDRLAMLPVFRTVDKERVFDIFLTLSKIYVRKGQNPKFFLTLSGLSFGSGIGSANARQIKFNEDLKECLNDLAHHLTQPGFMGAVERAFLRFDSRYGVTEALDDLASTELVKQKEAFVRRTFARALQRRNAQELAELLQVNCLPTQTGRTSVSSHSQNWVFERVVYLTGLNSAEDVQTRFKEFFEASGHKLRPHAPYGGHAQAVAFMLQGRDLCEQWSTGSRRRTLDADGFRELAWQSIAEAVIQGMEARGRRTSVSDDTVVRRYIENKSMRIISSDLNGFEIMIDHFLGDCCQFAFDSESDDEEPDTVVSNAGLADRIQRSWQTDIVEQIWGGRPLETWLEGVSNDGRWLIKVQSAQDGNEGHKTKELAGRCRGMCLVREQATDPLKRTRWRFGERIGKNRALVLDGDWNATQKKNLYEAGWTWVGDVSQLAQLRSLILQGAA